MHTCASPCDEHESASHSEHESIAVARAREARRSQIAERSARERAWDIVRGDDIARGDERCTHQERGVAAKLSAEERFWSFWLIWGPGLVIFASGSCHVVSSPSIELFIAIYLRYDLAKNRAIYRKKCRDKEPQGNHQVCILYTGHQARTTRAHRRLSTSGTTKLKEPRTAG